MYKIGDTITFTEEMFEAASLWGRSHGFIRVFSPNFLRKYLGKKGVIAEKRLDRFRVVLVIKWEDGQETNTLIFDYAGVEFEKPESLELSIFYCPEGLLSAREKIVKYIAEKVLEKFNVSQAVALEDAEDRLRIVDAAMKAHKIAFYIP